MKPPSSTLAVWFANTSSGPPGPIETCCEAWLEPEEIVRADRFRQPTSRNQHVVGRGMARKLLGEEVVAPNEIRFAEAVHGKPYVITPDAAKQPFNIAHTDGMVMCGVGQNHHELVGVDVERLGRQTDPAIAERFFSVPEIDYLRTKRDTAEYRNAFLKVWTLKESFIKAIGTGLQTPLADFAFVDVDTDEPKIEMLNPKLESDLNWHFFSFHPKAGFVAAVAVACRNDQPQIKLDIKCFDDLILWSK